jgi:hypothetical protein
MSVAIPPLFAGRVYKNSLGCGIGNHHGVKGKGLYVHHRSEIVLVAQAQNRCGGLWRRARGTHSLYTTKFIDV